MAGYVNFGGRVLPVLSETERQVIQSAIRVVSECVQLTNSEVCADAQADLAMLLLEADEGRLIDGLMEAGVPADEITKNLAEWLSRMQSNASGVIEGMQGGFAAQNIVDDLKSKGA